MVRFVAGMAAVAVALPANIENVPWRTFTNAGSNSTTNTPTDSVPPVVLRWAVTRTGAVWKKTSVKTWSYASSVPLTIIDANGTQLAAVCPFVRFTEAVVAPLPRST